MFRKTILSAVLILLPALAFDSKTEPSPEPPPDKPVGPVTLRIVPGTTTYTIDRKGLTPDQYKKALVDGTIAAPSVDLVLEFRNTTKEPLDLRFGGVATKFTMTLKGKGDIVTRNAMKVREPLRYMTLKPGERVTLPLSKIAGNTSSTNEVQHIWTQPGEYTLAVDLSTSIRGGGMAVVPNPGKVKKGLATKSKLTKVEISSPTITLTVKEK